MYCVYMQVVADILSNVLDESNTPAFTATETVSALYLYHCSVCTLDLILIVSNNILWRIFILMSNNIIHIIITISSARRKRKTHAHLFHASLQTRTRKLHCSCDRINKGCAVYH